jgi:hypothetical protein
MFVVSLLHVVEACGICVTFFYVCSNTKELPSLKMNPFNIKKKRLMLEDIQNTEDDHWTPSSGTTP